MNIHWWNHNFSNWEIDKIANMYDEDNPKHIEGKLVIQKRKCKTCNYIEFDKEVIRAGFNSFVIWK
jgi:hypothetical protein